ncbi:hypothetical protein IEQ34_003286 [Dendrobium chrysotoxum]|uniref:Uncharacterized protein n=1 Tax=Dendrobium chrysotoxum TaxID=161865 RepID=A0AAV7HJI7_DENCH|nr:hypothetical protein IEQ34_003286 [Dendrobium chrysotoxum]
MEAGFLIPLIPFIIYLLPHSLIQSSTDRSMEDWKLRFLVEMEVEDNCTCWELHKLEPVGISTSSS